VVVNLGREFEDQATSGGLEHASLQGLLQKQRRDQCAVTLAILVNLNDYYVPFLRSPKELKTYADVTPLPKTSTVKVKIELKKLRSYHNSAS
jgi:hypothetical protein